MTTPFSDWELRPGLQAVLQELQFSTPTEVQQAAWQPVLDGRDVMVQSRTGSGKTLAFSLPLLQRLDPDETEVKAIVILPTRELCLQVAQTMRRLANALEIRVAALYGGGNFQEQLRSLKSGAQIVCGTPGRLCEHIERRTLKLEHCSVLVLDEADEMLNMGFADELQRVVAQLPEQRQTLLFSATLADAVQKLARTSMHDPLLLSVSEALSMPEEITHYCYEVHPEDKMPALITLLHAETPARALVFCHTKAETEKLTERLRHEGFSAALLNGDLPQMVRTRTLQQFRQGLVSILVATDVAARGIDVEGITHVFNMAVPRAAETYVHRVGRTGRAGALGQAATFVSARDSRRFRQMLKDAGVRVELRPLPQAEDVRSKLQGRYLEQLSAVQPTAESRHLAKELLGFLAPADVIAALLERDPAARGLVSPVERIAAPPPPRWENVEPRPRRERSEAPAGRREAPAGPPKRLDKNGRPYPSKTNAGSVTLGINVGHRDHISVAGVVKLLCTLTGLPGDVLGAINIEESRTVFDVQARSSDRIQRSLQGQQYKGRPLKVFTAVREERPRHAPGKPKKSGR